MCLSCAMVHSMWHTVASIYRSTQSVGGCTVPSCPPCTVVPLHSPFATLRTWHWKSSAANILMATVNRGGGGNNSDFIMPRNSITAPLHITMQVQSYNSFLHTSVVLTAVLMEIQVFWYITPSWLVKSHWCVRAACCPHVRCRSRRHIGNLRYSSTHSELHYHRQMGG